MRQGHIFRTRIRVKDGNKTELITYPKKDGEVLLKSRMERKLHVWFLEGLGLATSSGYLTQEVRYGLYSTIRSNPVYPVKYASAHEDDIIAHISIPGTPIEDDALWKLMHNPVDMGKTDAKKIDEYLYSGE